MANEPTKAADEIVGSTNLPARERNVSWVVRGVVNARGGPSPPVFIDYETHGVRCPICKRWVMRVHQEAPMAEKDGAVWHTGPLIFTFFHAVPIYKIDLDRVTSDECRIECTIGDLANGDVAHLLEKLHETESERRRVGALSAPSIEDKR